MAELRLERHPAVVEQDLPEIYAFIARDGQTAAERVLDAVEAGFSQPTRHPESGVAFPTRNPKLKGMRSKRDADASLTSLPKKPTN